MTEHALWTLIFSAKSSELPLFRGKLQNQKSVLKSEDEILNFDFQTFRVVSQFDVQAHNNQPLFRSREFVATQKKDVDKKINNKTYKR